MAKGFTRSVTIDRPLEHVWNFFDDTGNISRWMPDIVRLEKVTEGPVRVGTKYRETRLIKGREHTETLEITDYEPMKIHSGTVDAKGIRGTYTYAFFEEGRKTRIELVAEVEGRGMMKLFVGFVVKAMEKMDGNQLVRLRKAIEGI